MFASLKINHLQRTFFNQITSLNPKFLYHSFSKLKKRAMIMVCEFCGKDPFIIVLVPHPDGSTMVFSCGECAIAQGVFCARHDRAYHIIQPNPFSTEERGTACLCCIEEETQEKRETAQQWEKRIRDALPREEQKRIEEWGDAVREIIGNEPLAVSILRALITKAHARKMTAEKIVEEIAACGSATPILPFPF
jgi:hypothetical protein